MIEEREIIERAVRAMAVEDDPWERLMSRRDRKRRNQRIGAAVLAIVIAVAGVGLFVSQYRGTGHQPETPTITPQNVSQLREIANDVTFPQEGFRMSTGDGMLVLGTTTFREPRGRLIAYPFPCGGDEGPCTPLWHADLDSPGLPTISDGMVYVAGLRGRTLYAFRGDCGSGGAACHPEWSADIRRWSTNQAPLVVSDASTNRVYIGTADSVLGFDVGCASGGGVCSPAWGVPMDQPVRALAYGDGVLYAGTGKPGAPDSKDRGSVTAFRTACASSARFPTRCRLWSRSVGQVWDLAVDGGDLFVGTNGGSRGVQSYPASCAHQPAPCRPLWVGATDCCTQLAVANGTVYADDQRDHAYAFPEACRSDGSACGPRWTSTGILGQPFVGFKRPLPSDGLVFVGGDEGWIYSFRQDCQGSCEPASRTFIPDQNGGPGIWDAVTLNDRLYVAATDGLHVFSAQEPSREGARSSAGAAPIFYLGIILVVGAVLTVRFVRRRGVMVRL